MSGAILKMVLSLCFPCLLVAACSTDPAAERPASGRATSTASTALSQVPTTGAYSDGTEVFFPKLQESEPTPLLSAKGEFFLDDEGCLRVNDVGARGDLGVVPLWPPQYELDTEGESIRVRDAKSRVVARVGEKLVMGGGAIDKRTLEEKHFMDERLMREMFERCSGNDYWMVLDGDVKLLSRR